MKRAKHSLSHYKLATFDMGELIPVSRVEVLPGDSIQQATACLLRVSPLLAPVMHPVQVRIHHWFVPYRIIWPEWEDFITGGKDGLGNGAVYPEISTGAGILKGSLLDYMGVPPGAPNLDISALPVYAYNKIVNEFYRDQDLVTERAEDDLSIFRVAWEKDYFTSARPWPQKGPDVSMPLGTVAPIQATGPLRFNDVNSAAHTLRGDASTSNALYGEGNPATGGMTYLDGLQADLTNASAVNVNDVRKAFALQRYQEARAMYGSRYTEYLRYLGIRSSDARLQRPEYLGGGKQTIAFSEVLKTGAGEDPAEAIGTMKGHGISAMRSRRYRRFFEEHGEILTLMSVRPKTLYADGLHRSWSRRLKEDYYQRELEHIGQQAILQKEVYASSATPDAEFGWQDRYSEYRRIPSTISGDFRDTLNFWHLARLFAADPVLNAAFVECDPSKRINAVQTEDTLWCMINNNIKARRMVGKPGTGRIL